MQQDVWTSRGVDAALTDDMKGYSVEASDGTIGKVARVNYQRTCVIVSTSGLFGKKRYVIPVGAVQRVDSDSRTIFVDVSKDEVENSPTYDDTTGVTDDCESKTGAYYAEILGSRTSTR